MQLPRIVAGPEAAAELAAMPCDVVLNGITGSTGLSATLAALELDGSSLSPTRSRWWSAARWSPRPRSRVRLLLSTRTSALAQCLRGGAASEVDRLILTASGGPFRGLSREQMRDVTPNQALAHRPGTWAG